MNIPLTWDLLVIIFFAVVCAYSFIVGKHESVKIIIATYIAIVAVQGLGNLLGYVSGYMASTLSMLGFALDAGVLAVTKLAAFTGVIIFLAIRGGYEIEYTKDMGSAMESLFVGLFGFSTAGLLMTTLLTFVAGRPLLDPQLATAPTLIPIIQNSQLITYMVQYQDVWFFLPALLLIIIGFFYRDAELS